MLLANETGALLDYYYLTIDILNTELKPFIDGYN